MNEDEENKKHKI